MCRNNLPVERMPLTSNDFQTGSDSRPAELSVESAFGKISKYVLGTKLNPQCLVIRRAVHAFPQRSGIFSPAHIESLRRAGAVVGRWFALLQSLSPSYRIRSILRF